MPSEAAPGFVCGYSRLQIHILAESPMSQTWARGCIPSDVKYGKGVTQSSLPTHTKKHSGSEHLKLSASVKKSCHRSLPPSPPLSAAGVAYPHHSVEHHRLLLRYQVASMRHEHHCLRLRPPAAPHTVVRLWAVVGISPPERGG